MKYKTGKRSNGAALIPGLAIVLLLGFAAPAAAQYDIYDLGYPVSTQDIQADNTNTVHIVWTSYSYMYYGKIVNNAITGKELVAKGINTVYWRPYVSVQPDGSSVHIAWTTGGHGNTLMHSWKTTGAWQTEEVLTVPDTQWLSQPTCAIDSSGIVHAMFVIWNDVRTNEWATIFYMRKLATGKWETKQQFTPLKPEYKHPMLFVSSEGRVHATWDIGGRTETDSYDAYYCTAPSGGKLAYANTVKLPKAEDCNVSGYGDLYVDRKGVVHRSIGGWSNTEQKMCIDHTKKPVGGSFEIPTRPSLGFLNLSEGDPVPAVVADEAGRIIVAWGQIGSDGANTLKASVYDPDTRAWSIFTIDPAAGIPESPNSYRVALTRTDTHIFGVWRGSEGQLKLFVLPMVTRDDILGTWDSSGVYYWNTETHSWVPLTDPADLVSAGDMDADSTDDLIGVWDNELRVRYSKTQTWAKLSASLPISIASDDMDGDGQDDVLGSWTSGVWCRNAKTGAWVMLSQPPASLVAAGDTDGDKSADLIGVWSSGLWVKNSSTRKWAKLSSTLPTDIATGDMNGDGKADVLGTWPTGVWYRNSATGSWVLMSSAPATLVAAGDIDGDSIDDLIGVWNGELKVKKSWSMQWATIPCTAHPLDMDAGLFRTGETADVAEYASPLFVIPDDSAINGDIEDLSDEGPGGWKFKFEQEENLVPLESDPKTILGPGDPRLQFEVQGNLLPWGDLEKGQAKAKNPKKE